MAYDQRWLAQFPLQNYPFKNRSFPSILYNKLPPQWGCWGIEEGKPIKPFLPLVIFFVFVLIFVHFFLFFSRSLFLSVKIMASNNSFLSFLLLILSSSLHLCLSQNSSGLDQLIPSLESVSVIQDAQCMKKLLPCQPFLKSQDKPPQTCCGPLNEMASNATDCLCSFFNNPKLLLSFNVSKDEILKLPNACGVDVDVSKCNSGNKYIQFF